MPKLAEQLEKIPALLAERAERYRVPGVETTSDSVFQIGSIPKLFTTIENDLTFVEFGAGLRAGYLHLGGRPAPRVS
ncbi:MAG: hypothetical protein V3V67_19690 [Myxococcota bacterium]